MGILGIESAEHLIWCFALGFMVACVYAFFSKRIIGKLIRALVREEASDEASAQTLCALGCKGALYKYALRKSARLSDSVIAVTAEGAENRYYLKPEQQEEALLKYGANPNSLMSLVVTLLAAMLSATVLTILLPFIKEYLSLA